MGKVRPLPWRMTSGKWLLLESLFCDAILHCETNPLSDQEV
jgi:hypothetical protein